MKTMVFPVIILALLLICPVFAESMQAVPTTAPEQGTLPAANVTATPTPTEPVASGIPATLVPVHESTAAPSAAPTDIMSLVPTTLLPAEVPSGIPATTIPLPPHEQDSGQGIPSDPNFPGAGIGGFVQPTVTGSETTTGETPGPAADMVHDRTCKKKVFMISCFTMTLDQALGISKEMPSYVGTVDGECQTIPGVQVGCMEAKDDGVYDYMQCAGKYGWFNIYGVGRKGDYKCHFLVNPGDTCTPTHCP
jgi:hypothetical protein